MAVPAPTVWPYRAEPPVKRNGQSPTVTVSGNQLRLSMPPQARRGRFAKNADALINQSREAHRSAYPLYSP
jgi:hypothetical protein